MHRVGIADARGVFSIAVGNGLQTESSLQKVLFCPFPIKYTRFCARCQWHCAKILRFTAEILQNVMNNEFLFGDMKNYSIFA